MPSKSFCAICQCLTSRYHEQQHRKSSLIPSSNTTTTSSFLVVESGSESETDDSDGSFSTFNSVLGDTSTGVDVDYPELLDLTQIRESAAHLREWLHAFPPISIYDSECGEERESWMERHEKAESASVANEVHSVDDVHLLKDDNVARELKNQWNRVEIEEVDSDSDFWGSDESFSSGGSDLGEDSTPEVDWDVFEQAAAGVSAFDRLNEEFEVETANIRE